MIIYVHEGEIKPLEEIQSISNHYVDCFEVNKYEVGNDGYLLLGSVSITPDLDAIIRDNHGKSVELVDPEGVSHTIKVGG